MDNQVAMQNNGSVASYGDHDPFSSYGQEAASSSATFLKFSKGEFLLGSEDKEVDEGTRYAANMDELRVGWVRWAQKKPAERRMETLVSGVKPAARDQLGYTDESDWETDADGRPQDPWQRTNELPLADPESGDQVVFSTSSTGGIGAIGNLCKEYGKQFRLKDGQVPLIELKVDSYKHTTYGKVYVPAFPIVDWVANDGAPPAAVTEDAKEETPEPKGSGAATRF